MKLKVIKENEFNKGVQYAEKTPSLGSAVWLLSAKSRSRQYRFRADFSICIELPRYVLIIFANKRHLLPAIVVVVDGYVIVYEFVVVVPKPIRIRSVAPSAPILYELTLPVSHFTLTHPAVVLRSNTVPGPLLSCIKLLFDDPHP